ncbi:50S ribosomal protein L25, partial [Gammaproteobacteria bacterium]|nr:50S ribosomal protein L25 [Gammaproteobacteria bacterium]
LSELVLPEGAEIPGFDAENDQMVVSVNAPRAEEEEEAAIESEEADGKTSSEVDAETSDNSEGSDGSDENS